VAGPKASPASPPGHSVTRLYVFDADPIDLRGRASQLRSAGINNDWAVSLTPSRNQLLKWLDEDVRSSPKRHSVCLIDFRRSSDDLEQTGFRIVETIRRHEHLWKATRPVIWVDSLTRANIDYARGVGAEGIVDDDWVDRREGTPLVEVLEWAIERPPKQERPGGDFTVFPADNVPADDDTALRDERFQRWFGFRPDDLDFRILWGLADAVELKFLREYFCDQGWTPSDRAAERAIYKLQQHMRSAREELDRPEPTNAEIARRFLAEAVPAAPSPLSEISWPSIAHVRDVVLSNPEIGQLAFLEPDARPALDRFFGVLGQGPTDIAGRHRAIEGAVTEVAKSLGRPRTAVHGLIHRSCHAVDDAYDDWRRHGMPVSDRD
jgi:hypothetical protein